MKITDDVRKYAAEQGIAEEEALNLNSAIETAKYAKYAKGEPVEKGGVFTCWVKRFLVGKCGRRALFSRISHGSRFISTAVSRLKKGMEEKSKEFVENGAEVYAKA